MIRLATIDDVGRIVEMGRKFWSLTAYRDIPYCIDSIAESCAQMLALDLLLVADEGRVIAACGLLACPLYANRSYLIASELFWWVDEEHRNSGVGRDLLLATEAQAKAKGVNVLGMMCLEAVEPEKAASMYKRLGYVPSERTFMKAL